ncbi:unnamed protein product [Peronospora belbahrii]|uniref:Uncharacterized protein n=1 Tax=Peronospora belbahrii TaxID=622444 RepID=A0AAU9L8R8_9STRA|nr:unnamed protein product [Peronospora belbahrii]
MLLFVKLLVALTSLVSYAASTVSSNDPVVIELFPEVSLSSQTVQYGIPRLFRIVDLEPATVYDIKVSYPATQPSRFMLQVERVRLRTSDNIDVTNANIVQNIATSQPIPHRILNTVKLRLYPNEAELHKSSMRYRLKSSETAVEVEFSLFVQVEGVRHPESKMKTEKCVFDIVVEKVLFEAFPKTTLWLIGWLLLLLFTESS